MDWRQQGSAQRRRAGAPSSHLTGAGHPSGSWSPPTSPTENLASATDPMAEGLAGMAGNSRQPIGRDALAGFVNTSAKSTAPISHPKGGNLAKDPAVQMGGSAHRTPKLNTGENGGARFGIKVNLPGPVAHEAGPTQANGRIVSGGIKRSFSGQ